MKKLALLSLASLLLVGCQNDEKTFQKAKEQLSSSEAVKTYKMKLKDEKGTKGIPPMIYEYLQDKKNNHYMFLSVYKNGLNRKPINVSGFAFDNHKKQYYRYKTNQPTSTPEVIESEHKLNVLRQVVMLQYDAYAEMEQMFKAGKAPKVKQHEYTFDIKENPKMALLTLGMQAPLNHYNEQNKASEKQLNQFIDVIQNGQVTYTISNKKIKKVIVISTSKKYKTKNKQTYEFSDFGTNEKINVVPKKHVRTSSGNI